MQDYFFVRANCDGRFNNESVIWAGKLPCAEIEYGELIYRIWVDCPNNDVFVSSRDVRNLDAHTYTSGMQFVSEKFGTNIWLSISSRFITKVEKMDEQSTAEINEICKKVSTCKLPRILAVLATATYEV